MLNAPRVLHRLVDVAEDAVLAPATPGMHQLLKRSIFTEMPDVRGVVLEEGVAPVAFLQEMLAQEQAH
eukprot:12622055-Alexandrium_andersonii.AAC.1